MTDERENKRISKFLSFVLRHKPEALGIVLDENGWTDIATLLAKLSEQGLVVTRQSLAFIVTSNSKQRFAIDATGTKIRASQGHSIAVDLDLPATAPPEFLFHGTAEKNLASIIEHGLQKGQRHHVHLSMSTDIAKNVGQRHGRPVIFKVSALSMHGDGHAFYISANNVWLVDQVPPQYLKLM